MSQDWRRQSDRLSFDLAPFTYQFVLINFVFITTIQIFQQTGKLRDASINIERLPVFMVFLENTIGYRVFTSQFVKYD